VSLEWGERKMAEKSEKAKKFQFWRTFGAANIAVTASPQAIYRLVRMEVHLSAAPTTSENLTLTLNYKGTTAYNVVIYKRDLSVGSVTDIVALFGEGYEFEEHDTIVLAYANTDVGTIGVRLVTQLL